ncbi:MAG: biotin transporter BioY [Janthinobacterium lividum]
MPIANSLNTSIHGDAPAMGASRQVLLCLSATLVVALAAHVSFPLPFTPVPFTLQPLAVLGVGLALGPIAGTVTMLAYLAEGASGLPVFSPTGLGGVAQLFGPTGGYLLAYPFVAFVCGLVSRRPGYRLSAFPNAVLACALATALLFVFGATWLSVEAHLSPRAAWTAGVLPFLPGEAVKVLAAAGIFRALKGPLPR